MAVILWTLEILSLLLITAGIRTSLKGEKQQKRFPQGSAAHCRACATTTMGMGWIYFGLGLALSAGGLLALGTPYVVPYLRQSDIAVLIIMISATIMMVKTFRSAQEDKTKAIELEKNNPEAG